jgi:hypothetical protein
VNEIGIGDLYRYNIDPLLACSIGDLSSLISWIPKPICNIRWVDAQFVVAYLQTNKGKFQRDDKGYTVASQV